MEIILFVILLGIAAAVIAYGVRSSSQKDAYLQETIERRKAFVASISPTARVIVNNGTHLFFKDDVRQIFGVDESGKTYDFSGLHSISVHRDCINLMHRKSSGLCIGRDYSHKETTFPLDPTSIATIKAEMLPVLRKNLYMVLEKAGVSPTHEYEHDGEIWGCDINSKKFYVAYGDFSVYNFSDLRRVTVEDLRNNSLYDGSYIIHVYVKSDFDWGDDEFEIHFKEQNSTFDSLLSMFKGIQNRKYR